MPAKKTVAQKAAENKAAKPTKRQQAVKLSALAKEELADREAKRAGIKPKGPPKRPRAKPGETFQKITPELLDMVLERIAGGESLTYICADPNMPPQSIVNRWRQLDPAFGIAFDQALRIRAATYAESIVADAESALGLSSEGVAAKRLLVDAKKWVASKLIPQTYGDKIIHAGDQENPVQVAMVKSSQDLLKKIKGGNGAP